MATTTLMSERRGDVGTRRELRRLKRASVLTKLLAIWALRGTRLFLEFEEEFLANSKLLETTSLSLAAFTSSTAR